MVMAESMACGTPVIAFGCGAVKEVIDEGITGFVVENETEMLNTLPKIKSLNRKICRETAEKKYDTTIITNEYLTLFRND
ncbi:Glycosyl transferases group 1 [compost metagenome]